MCEVIFLILINLTLLHILIQKKKERGRIQVNSVKVVEEASVLDLGGEGSVPQGFPLQVGYVEAGQDYILYLLARDTQERDDWINSLRTGKCA